ncbi:MAG: polyphosphate--glucose phosphotransferase [Planctomycetota bacterium]
MHILGVDIGGSGIKGAPVDIKTGILLAERLRIPTPELATPAAVAAALGELVRHFNWKGPVGCGFPAVIMKGTARTAANVDKSWIGTDAEALFRTATGCPVRVLNDADAAGTAEMAYGAGRGHEGLVLILTVGTGLGTAMFTRGVLVPNLEFGHVIMANGQEGEHFASDAARKREDLDWDAWGDRFNAYLCYVHALFWPELIVVGGGASKKFAKFAGRLTVPTKVTPATLLNEAGLIGAALAARELA